MLSTSTPSGRVRGAGAVLLLLGLFGALVPFVGPSFGYGMGTVAAWTWTEGRATLHLAPGIAAIIGALLILRGRARSTQLSGALLAAAGGAWFVIAPSLHPLWASTGGTDGMSGMGESATSSALSALGYHYGTGVVIALVAAYAAGRLVASRDAIDDVPAAPAEADGPARSEPVLVESRS